VLQVHNRGRIGLDIRVIELYYTNYNSPNGIKEYLYLEIFQIWFQPWKITIASMMYAQYFSAWAKGSLFPERHIKGYVWSEVSLDERKILRCGCVLYVDLNRNILNRIKS